MAVLSFLAGLGIFRKVFGVSFFGVCLRIKIVWVYFLVFIYFGRCFEGFFFLLCKDFFFVVIGRLFLVLRMEFLFVRKEMEFEYMVGGVILAFIN